QQCRALLASGRIPRPPDASSAPHAPAVKAQEAALLPLGQVDSPAFLLVDGDLEGGHLLPEALVHGLEEPIMRRIGLHQDHESVREPGLCEVGILTTAGGLLRPRPAPLHRSGVQLTSYAA